jgi:hypothetical protein
VHLIHRFVTAGPTFAPYVAHRSYKRREELVAMSGARKTYELGTGDAAHVVCIGHPHNVIHTNESHTGRFRALGWWRSRQVCRDVMCTNTRRGAL